MQPSSSCTLSRCTLEKLETEVHRYKKPYHLLEMPTPPKLNQKSNQSRPSKALALSKVKEFLRRLHEIVGGKMFPHLAVISQWASLVLIITLNLNFSIAVTGAMASDGLKVVLVFHLWLFFVPSILCLMFYRIRRVGMPERCIVVLSIAILFVSIVNIFLHFVDDLVSLMKSTEVIAWGLYNGMFSVSVYRVSTGVLLPALGRDLEIEKERVHKDKKSGFR